VIEHKGKIVRALEAVLDREINIQERYLEVLDKERSVLPAFKADLLAPLTAEREELSKQMHATQIERVELMKQFPEFRGKKLSDLVQLHCHAHDAKNLLKRINRLKSLVAENKSGGSEFGQVAQFTLNLVNGVLSLFWSATQNVSRSYTRKGKVRESYNQQGSRHSGVLKQA
jgi:hypothetical protein